MHRNLKRLTVGSGCVIAATCALCLAGTIDLRLIQAVTNNDLESAGRLIKERVDVNARYGDGSTALAWAAYYDNLAIADLLIRSGANVNAANEEGAAPLHLAPGGLLVCEVGDAKAAVERRFARLQLGWPKPEVFSFESARTASARRTPPSRAKGAR